jgi:hypothetical protein
MTNAFNIWFFQFLNKQFKRLILTVMGCYGSGGDSDSVKGR